ncbi:MAG: multicopper oxidase family protein [Myxococcales bacterium]|nr:multicopper oxidase family protein [Myxococcales bacterium]
MAPRPIRPSPSPTPRRPTTQRPPPTQLAADPSAVDAAPPPPPAPLIGPAPAADTDPAPDVVAFDLVASVELVTLADGLRYSGMAYNGQVPGPTIEAKVGDTLEVRFTNDLDEPTTVHWHGLRIPDDMDGNPRIQAPVQPGETFTYRFTLPEAGTFWYHPHVRTNQQLEKGLYGVVVVRDPAEPRPAAERVLALDDILIDERGALYPFLASHPEVMHGRNGNVLLTNGKIEADVGAARQGDVERWRLVNTANARTMTLTLDGASFRVIGTDGGPLVEPYTADRLQIAVGQRYDLEVRYDRPGQVVLNSHVPVLEGDQVVERAFPVYAVDVEDTGAGPVALDWPTAAPIDRAADGEAELRFNARQGARGLEWTLNGQAHPMEPLHTFSEGDTMTLVLINEAGPEHPFHLHGQFFEIVPDGRPETEQPGLKDTVLVPGLSTVRVKAYLDNPGQWMAHCHILEHAELGMMAEFVVEPAAE